MNFNNHPPVLKLKFFFSLELESGKSWLTALNALAKSRYMMRVPISLNIVKAGKTTHPV